MSSSGLPAGLLDCPAPLVETFDVALTDLDGVCFMGTASIPYAAEGIAAASGHGMRFCFLTNNASRPPAAAAEHLGGVGIPAQADDIFTAAQAIAFVIAGDLPPGSRVLVVGAAGMWQAVEEAGLVPVASALDNPAAVVQGWGPEVNWAILAEAAYAITAGARFYASNLDRTLPTERGFAPGNGALVAALQTATGVEPITSGKPRPEIFHQAAERFGAARPLAIGDRLDTDLAGARAAGIPGLMVLTGVNSAADAITAPPAFRPGLIGADLRTLLDAHPAPRLAEGSWVSGNAWARIRDGHCEAGGSDAGRIDLIRAVASAFWQVADDGEPVDLSDLPPAVLD